MNGTNGKNGNGNGNNRAIGYVRVSTQEQARTGISIPDQEARIKDYCKFAGLVLVDIIKDPGVSAGTPLAKRPGGAQLLKQIPEVGNVIALKLDRLFRNVDDCRQHVFAWDKADKCLHLIDFGGQAFNTKTALGRAFLTVASTFAELEREMASERIRYGMERLAIEGRYMGTRLPLGYRWDKETGKVVIDEDEAPAVREIFQLRAAGNSYDKIAELIAKKGYRGKNGTARIGNVVIRRMLQNRTYIGERELPDGDIVNLTYIEKPLIEEELFDQVQDTLKHHADRGGRNRYLLSGLLRCGLCSQPMIHNAVKNRGYADYICKGRKLWKDCKGVSTREAIAEDYIVEKFFQRVEGMDYSDAAQRAQARLATIQREAEGLRKKLARIEGQQDKLLKLHLEDKVDYDAYQRQDTTLAEQREGLLNELQLTEEADGQPPKWEGNIREDWLVMNTDERRKALRLFMDHVIVKPGRTSDRFEIVWKE